MKEIKKKMITSLISELSALEVYHIIGTYGRAIFEQLVDTFREEAPKVKLNKRSVDHHMESLFKKDSERGWGPIDGSTYRSMSNYKAGVLGVMHTIYKEEIKRRILLALKDDYDMWKEIEEFHEFDLDISLNNLVSYYMNEKYNSSYPSAIKQVEQTSDIDEYVYSEMFRFTSEYLKEKNNKALGFSFSNTLMCVVPKLIGKKKYGKGRYPTRHAMVHLCPNLPMPQRFMIRSINNMNKPPAFFCKHCKEKLTKAHKTVWSLIMLGRKL